MNEEITKYEKFVIEEDEMCFKLKTYQEVISEILMLINKQGVQAIHLPTLEEIIETIHLREVMCHNELLKLRIAKHILSNKIRY